MQELFTAVVRNDIRTLGALLAQGVPVDTPNANGYTALQIGALKGAVASMALLLEHGADPRRRTPAGIAAVHIAAHKGYIGVLQLLAERGLDLEEPDAKGATPATFATAAGKSEVEAFLRLYAARQAIVRLRRTLGADEAALEKAASTLEARRAAERAAEEAAVDLDALPDTEAAPRRDASLMRRLATVRVDVGDDEWTRMVAEHGRWIATGGVASWPPLWRSVRHADVSFALLLGPSANEGAQADLFLRTVAITSGRGADLRASHLCGVVAPGVDLREANLARMMATDADLRGARFDGADLTQADFSRSDLRWAVFDGADLSLTDFENCDLRHASFVGARLRGTRFPGADLAGARRTGEPDREDIVPAPRVRLVLDRGIDGLCDALETDFPGRSRWHADLLLMSVELVRTMPACTDPDGLLHEAIHWVEGAMRDVRAGSLSRAPDDGGLVLRAANHGFFTNSAAGWAASSLGNVLVYCCETAPYELFGHFRSLLALAATGENIAKGDTRIAAVADEWMVRRFLEVARSGEPDLGDAAVAALLAAARQAMAAPIAAAVTS